MVRKEGERTMTSKLYHSRIGVSFRWEGGEYIDVGEYRSIDNRGHRRDFVAFDVINVWDYGTNKPRDFQMGEVCREWLYENRQYLDDFRMAAGI